MGWFGWGIENISSNDLLEDTVEKYPKFKFVILIALYHILNTVYSKNEFLTVL